MIPRPPRTGEVEKFSDDFHGTAGWQLIVIFVSRFCFFLGGGLVFFIFAHQIWRTILPDGHPVKLGISNY